MIIQIVVDPAVSQRLAAMPTKLNAVLARVVSRTAQEGAADMKGEAARQKIAARSTLINSIKADKVDALSWKFGPHVNYAMAVYEGRRPGQRMPPPQAIFDWMRVKRMNASRGAAWAVARSIGRRGIKGRDYVTPVVDRSRARLLALGTAAVQEVIS